MKKTYVKPKIYFENFQLSTNIAYGCGAALGHAMYSCNDKLTNGFFLFTDEETCDVTPDAAGYCYQSLAEERTLFTS